MTVRIKVVALRGTTSYDFETVHDGPSHNENYVHAEADAQAFEKWLSAQPERQDLNDRRSREGAR